MRSDCAFTTLSGVTSFRTSTDGINYSDWFNYVVAPSANLGSGDGEKAIYVQFKDAAGNVSEAYTDTIILDTSVGSDFGLSINSGALYATSTAVVLTIPAQAGTAEMQVSNDGGFIGVLWEPYALYKNWQITSFGSHIIPRTVYVRFRDTIGTTSSTFQDDIILDTTAPVSAITELVLSPGNAQHAIDFAVQSTTVPITVRWAGTDDVSGVRWYDIQVRTADSAWTTWLVQTTGTEAVYQAQPGQVYYFQSRAQDNAGNWEEYPGGEGHRSILVCPDFVDPPGTDIGEVQAVAGQWHKRDTDPDWSSIQQLDLDKDGAITVADIMHMVVIWAACS